MLEIRSFLQLRQFGRGQIGTAVQTEALEALDPGEIGESCHGEILTSQVESVYIAVDQAGEPATIDGADYQIEIFDAGKLLELLEVGIAKLRGSKCFRAVDLERCAVGNVPEVPGWVALIT